MIFDYKLIRSQRRTLALHITKDGNLEARAPIKLPLETIEAFIHKKQDWITSKMEQINNRKVQPKTYKAGETFLYLGQSYELSFSETQKLPVELKDKLYVASRHQHRAKKVLIQWLWLEAHILILKRVQHYMALTGYAPKDIKMSTAQHRWGSCSALGNVNFCWRLIMAPLEIIDYVVVHELVHLKQHDHSKAFWSKVEHIMPDYKARRLWLKTHGAELTL